MPWLPAVNQHPHTSDHLATNLWTCPKPGGGFYQYACWYNLTGTEVRVGRIERDSFGRPLQRFGDDHDEHIITAASAEGVEFGLPVPDDDHNFTCIFVTWDGKIHVLCNMHGYPSNGLRYITSAGPYEIDDWDVPVNPLPDCVEKTQYPMPTLLADGAVMLYMRQNPWSHGGTGLANGAYWIYKNGASAWSSKHDWLRGVPLTGPGSDTIVDGGQTPADIDVAENYSPYITMPRVEPPWSTVHPGRVHVFLIWRQFDIGGDGSAEEIDRTNVFPSYMFSDDHAETWRALNPASPFGAGIPLTTPIEAWVDQGQRTGLVCPPGQPVDGYINFGGSYVDDVGIPHLIFSTQHTYHATFDWVFTNTWFQEAIPNPINGYLHHSRKTAIWHAGQGWFFCTSSWRTGTRTPMMHNLAGTATYRMGGRVDPGGGWEFGYDVTLHDYCNIVSVLTPQGSDPFTTEVGGHATLAVAP